MAIRLTLIACKEQPIVIELADDTGLVIESTLDPNLEVEKVALSVTDDGHGRIFVDSDNSADALVRDPIGGNTVFTPNGGPKWGSV